MQLLKFAVNYVWLIVRSWLGLTLLVLGILQFGEWIIGKKAPIPRWVRLTACAALLFLAQAAAYNKLTNNPPVVLETPAPPAPLIMKEPLKGDSIGNATTSGNESPAVTGGSSSVIYGQAPEYKKQKPKLPK